MWASQILKSMILASKSSCRFDCRWCANLSWMRTQKICSLESWICKLADINQGKRGKWKLIKYSEIVKRSHGNCQTNMFFYSTYTVCLSHVGKFKQIKIFLLHVYGWKTKTNKPRDLLRRFTSSTAQTRCGALHLAHPLRKSRNG